MRVEPGRPVGYRREHDQPPPRPARLDELPFTPQPSVRWYSPFVLAKAGMQVVMASAFGSFLDKRELQTVMAQPAFADLSDLEEVWIDYVADTGDGFDATYTVASLVGRPELAVDGVDHPLPRADLLLLGGDQVYPDATAGGYEHRLEGPFTAALPWTPPDRRPAMFAIPGNHDWYDGLTSFMRVFGQQKSLGGWQTYQTRSYYGIKLPHRWWLLGLDVQLDAYIDEPQLRFFEGLEIAPGDRVILCTAEPSWVDAPADPEAYHNLAYLERKILTPKGADLAVTIAGDLHHYARYQQDHGDRQLITAGGGGAFLHGTHGVPPHTSVRTEPDDPDTATPFSLSCTYPTQARSRLLAWGTLGLPWRNPSFMLLPGVLYGLLTAELLRTLTAQARSVAADGPSPAGPAEVSAALADLIRGASPLEVFAGIFASPMSLALLVVVLVALVAFAKPPRRTRPHDLRRSKTALGVGHTAGHAVTVALVAWMTLGAWARLDGWLGPLLSPQWPLTAVAYALAFAVGAVAGSLVFALYLVVANLGWAAEGNHAFSAQRRAGYKNFLRLRLDREGALEAYAIGIDRACHDWAAAPDATGEDRAWLVPAGDEPNPRVIDHVRWAGTPSAG